MLLGKVKLENKRSYYSLLFLLGMVFFFINVLTPLFSDDWHYGFIFKTSIHIQSMADVLKSQYIHYFIANGRFIPHFLLQSFDGLLNKSVFDIANALVFILFIHLLNLNFVEDKKLFFKSTAVIAFCITLLSCGFTCSFLWMSGAFNYLWGFTLLLLFNYLFNHRVEGKYYYPLLFLIGIICGWTNEAYITGYSCCILHLLYKSRNALCGSQIALSFGLFVGTTLLCLSPGSIHRSGISHSTFSIISFVWGLISSLTQMSNLRLFFVALLIVLLRKESRNHWLIALIIAFVFVLLTGHAADHSRFGIEMFALIIILKFIDFRIISNRVSVIISLVTFLTMTAAVPLCYGNYKVFKRMERFVTNTSDGIIPFETTSTPLVLDRFIIHYDKGFSYNKTDWFNTNVAMYYGVQPLTFIQKELLDDIRNGKKFDDFECPSKYLWYVREWESNDSIRSVKFKMSPSSYSSLPILNKMDRFTLTEMPVNHYSLVEIDNRKFIIVTKNSTIDKRVISIDVVVQE